jgi:hypothetical protein
MRHKTAITGKKRNIDEGEPSVLADELIKSREDIKTEGVGGWREEQNVSNT